MLTESDLRIRSAKLGASECAAAAGLDPFCPPIKLFLRRTGREPRDESPQADWGNVMEPVIADWYARERGVALASSPTLVHPTEDWACATPDRIVVGSGKLVQVKNVGPNVAWHWKSGPDGCPDYVQAQEQWEMWVAGADEADVVAAIAGAPPTVYAIPRDDEFIAMLVAVCRRFWFKQVLADVFPAVDGSDTWKAFLSRRFPRSERPAIRAPEGAAQIVREYAEATEAEKSATDRKKAAANKLKAMIGEHEGIWGPWGRVNWKANAKGIRTLDVNVRQTKEDWAA